MGNTALCSSETSALSHRSQHGGTLSCYGNAASDKENMASLRGDNNESWSGSKRANTVLEDTKKTPSVTLLTESRATEDAPLTTSRTNRATTVDTMHRLYTAPQETPLTGKSTSVAEWSMQKRNLQKLEVLEDQKAVMDNLRRKKDEELRMNKKSKAKKGKKSGGDRTREQCTSIKDSIMAAAATGSTAESGKGAESIFTKTTSRDCEDLSNESNDDDGNEHITGLLNANDLADTKLTPNGRLPSMLTLPPLGTVLGGGAGRLTPLPDLPFPLPLPPGTTLGGGVKLLPPMHHSVNNAASMSMMMMMIQMQQQQLLQDQQLQPMQVNIQQQPNHQQQREQSKTKLKVQARQTPRGEPRIVVHHTSTKNSWEMKTDACMDDEKKGNMEDCLPSCNIPADTRPPHSPFPSVSMSAASSPHRLMPVPPPSEGPSASPSPLSSSLFGGFEVAAATRPVVSSRLRKSKSNDTAALDPMVERASDHTDVSGSVHSDASVTTATTAPAALEARGRLEESAVLSALGRSQSVITDEEFDAIRQLAGMPINLAPERPEWLKEEVIANVADTHTGLAVHAPQWSSTWSPSTYAVASAATAASPSFLIPSASSAFSSPSTLPSSPSPLTCSAASKLSLRGPIRAFSSAASGSRPNMPRSALTDADSPRRSASSPSHLFSQTCFGGSVPPPLRSSESPRPEDMLFCKSKVNKQKSNRGEVSALTADFDLRKLKEEHDDPFLMRGKI